MMYYYFDRMGYLERESIVPAKNTTIETPPDVEEGFIQRFIGGAWIVETIADRDKNTESSIIVPQSLKMAQCRAQLIIDGKDDDVELLINSIEDPIKQKLYRAFWEYEPIVLRDNAMINEMAPLLNIDLDSFFVNASKL